VVSASVTAPDGPSLQSAIEEQVETLSETNAIVHVERESATAARVITVAGGTVASVEVAYHDEAGLEAAISEQREALIAEGAQLTETSRRLAYRFTVTNLAQLLTAFYFAFFLIILPVLGLRETPSRVPETVAKSIKSGDSQPPAAVPAE
jgi:ubiquinol-cytochrome c reductase cytochrome b subunit